ncbi:MAG TPA: hypothetical protein VHC45_05375 [Gaiellaceae bacterium]|nr:hypothetical protein [Gaiellaceae bacterium]
MGRSLSAFSAVCVLAAGVATAAAAPATRAQTFSRTITVKWPERTLEQTGYLRPLDVDSSRVASVTAAFPDGTRIESGRPGVAVACKHSGASYASLGWVVQGSGLWVTIVLQTGQCSPGPSVAGRPVTIRLVVRTR